MDSVYVLGTAAGFSQTHNVNIGTHVSLHFTT